MFQLTTPLTPAPGRTGPIGVPGAGRGKSAIDLPDFMTFALSGAPAQAPGNARQDPAGGGEAVPGGTLIAPPAGHPDAKAGVAEMTPAVGLPIAATEPAAERPVTIDGPLAPPKIRKSLTRDTDIAAVMPKKARLAPASDAPIRSDEETKPTVARVVHPDRTRDPEAEPASVGSIDIPFASAPRDAAPTPTAIAPAPLGPPTVAAPAPTVGGSPDATLPAAATAVARKTRDAGRPVERTADAANPESLILPSSVAKPFIGIGEERSPASSVGRRGVDPRSAANREAVVRSPVEPVPSDQPAITAPGAEPVAGTTVPLGPPNRDTVSLGTIARMLAAGPAPASAAAPASPEPLAIAAALPAMPASVAAFLASVAPRPLVMPSPDALPKPAQQAAVDGIRVAVPIAPVAQSPIVIQSAGQLFADAIHAATGQRDRSIRAPADDIVATMGQAPAPVTTASAAIDRTPLDMTQGHWPMKMIERIEVLRDAADAQDTRIKLIPDALGAIDVSMRRDGDTVRVHLAAERPETRAMIADAQPRLAELGEQRGLKIAASSGQTSGQAMPQDSHQPRGNPAPQQPVRPASARAGDQPATDDDGDQRLA